MKLLRRINLLISHLYSETNWVYKLLDLILKYKHGNGHFCHLKWLRIRYHQRVQIILLHWCSIYTNQKLLQFIIIKICIYPIYFSSYKIPIMVLIYSLKAQICLYLYSDLNLKRNLLIKFNTQYAIQLVCLLNSLIWFPSDIKLIMLLILSKDSRIKSIFKFCWITLIHSDISLKSETLKSFKVMIILVFTEMSLLIHQLALTSWDFWRIKWKKKVEIQEPWMKFKIFSKSLNLNISELHLKNSGFKISMNSVKLNSTQHLKLWWGIY